MSLQWNLHLPLRRLVLSIVLCLNFRSFDVWRYFNSTQYLLDRTFSSLSHSHFNILHFRGLVLHRRVRRWSPRQTRNLPSLPKKMLLVQAQRRQNLMVCSIFQLILLKTSRLIESEPLFAKFCFLLTSASRQISDGEDHIPFRYFVAYPSFPFHWFMSTLHMPFYRKNELKMRILEHGGYIIDSVFVSSSFFMVV